MIRGLSFALAAALLVLPLGAHAQAQAQWDKTLHDFGTFHESQGNRSCAFAVKNDGDSPLVLTRVLSSCGCTVAKYDTEPIMPGKSGTVEITYSPTGRPGPFEKAVWVYSNGEPRKTRLVVKGVVVGTAETVSQYFPVAAGDLHFTTLTIATGEVKKGLMRQESTVAYNGGSDSLVIGFDNNTSHITCQSVPDTIAPGGIASLSFFFDSLRSPVWGINDDNVTIVAKPLHGNKAPSNINLNMVTNVVEDFSQLTSEELASAPVCSLSTTRLLIENLERGKTAAGIVVVENSGKSNLVIRRAMPASKAVVAKVDKTLLKPGEKAKVKVNVYPAQLQGNVLNTQFTLTTSDPANPRVTVRVVGEILR